jgi:hypothetical protein
LSDGILPNGYEHKNPFPLLKQKGNKGGQKNSRKIIALKANNLSAV